MARIDYASFVGQTFTNEKTGDRYLVREYLGDKLYTIQFVDENGGFLKGHEQTAEKYTNVVKGKCKDKMAIKIKKAKDKKAKNDKKNRLSHKCVENYERIQNLSSKTILSIDCSTSCTGLALYKDGVIKTKEITPPKGVDKKVFMRDEIEKTLDRNKVEVVFYEKPLVRFFNTTLILASLMGYIEALCKQKKIKFVCISPSSWQSYCGIHTSREEGKKLSRLRAIEKTGRHMREDESDAFNMLDYCMTLEDK